MGAVARVWQVGALCRAVADALEARFNPVTVRGEISGFSRASSGHCYFSVKDEQGQIRCAMFRRAASLLLRGEALLSANPSIRERLAKLLTMGEAEMAAIEKELGL